MTNPSVKLKNFWMLFAQWCRILVAHLARPVDAALPGGIGYQAGAIAPESRLSAKVIRKNGDIDDLGILSTKVVTTAFVNFLVDQLQSSTGQIAAFDYHGMGTGAVAEAVGDTALGTQVESRVQGTKTEGASANIYRTVATITASAARAITEHGVFNASTAGTLMDRSVFTVINLANGDGIQFTYELTVPAGS